MSTGALRPDFHLTVDISNADVDIDVPGIDSLLEFLAEQAQEEVLDALQETAVRVGMAFLDDNRLAIGEYATLIMREIANREHVFRSLRMDDRGWLIETMDSAQLAMPFVESDPIDHRFDRIERNAAPVVPIDGPMPRNATERLGRVEHLVFLMMENRSFDHMLGYLSHPNHGGRSDVDGLDGRSIALGGDFLGTLATPQSRPHLEFMPDPGHGFETTARQINGGAMNGFVSEFAQRLNGSNEINPQGNLNDPERILRFYTAEQLETYDRLSRTDLILDRWFCSIPGATYPNRICYYAGASRFLNNAETYDDGGYLTELTLFDLLDHEKVHWLLYESDVSFLRMFDRYRLNRSRIRPIQAFFRGDNTQPLPPVTFIDPNFTGAPSAGPPNDDHPTTSVADGQCFIENVVARLQDLPSWSSTMLVILYDEHGGFADHVPPPGTAASDFPPDANGSATVPLAHPDAVSYGPRVPVFVVSPLVKAGGIGHKIYDHATVYRTILERFMPRRRNSVIVPDRVRRARHLGELVGPDINGGSQEIRFPNPRPCRPVQPDAAFLSDAADYRPHMKSPRKDVDDFHYYLTRLGNPIKAPL